MSKYDGYPTEITNGDHLAAALKAMGYVVECHAEAQTLIDYHGHPRPEKANVIVRREHIGSASNDVGFVRGADGKYTAIISEYDREVHCGADWMARLKVNYQEQRQVAIMRAKGFTVASREVVQTAQGQRVRLAFQGR